MAEFLRRALRGNRHWVRMRRIQREGAINAFIRWHRWRKILGTRPIRTDPATDNASIELHILCCERDYLCAIWALKSFYYFAAVTYPLAIHLQGRCPQRLITCLRHHFPQARIIAQAEADPIIEAELSSRGLRRLREVRRQTPFILKLTDFLISCRAPRLLILDSDVLFFARPHHLIESVHSTLDMSLFQRDPESTYNISVEYALERFGVHLQPAINTGIAIVPRDAVSLERCEEFLTDGEVARPNGFVEQTLYALCASERLKVRYLPENYLVSLRPNEDTSNRAARHYAGPSRPLFTSEGLPELIGKGFLEKAYVQA